MSFSNAVAKSLIADGDVRAVVHNKLTGVYTLIGHDGKVTKRIRLNYPITSINSIEEVPVESDVTIEMKFGYTKTYEMEEVNAPVPAAA